MHRDDMGKAVFGGVIALVGALLLLDRTGVLTWTAGWSVWPLLLIGYGISRLVQSRYDAPRGLLPIALGLWLIGGEAGYIVWRDTWPLLLIVIGIAMAWGSFVGREPRIAEASTSPSDPMLASGRRRRRHRWPLPPLAILILIVLAASADRDRFAARAGSSDRMRAIAVLGPAKQVSTAEVFTGADVVSVMGDSDLDLRSATLPPAGEASIDVTVVMGRVVVRVPPDWVVDVRAVPVAAGIHDRRRTRSDTDATRAPSNAPSRLVLTGYIVMGNLDIQSEGRRD